LTEDDAQQPVNPYGYTKLVVERMLRHAEAAYGTRHVALRYFNAAGADPDGELREMHDPETHLIPLVLFAAMGRQPSVKVFGSDYSTADGTCVRDYVHLCAIWRMPTSRRSIGWGPGRPAPHLILAMAADFQYRRLFRPHDKSRD
jgi:UDP-glucose 4-epimerase